MSKPVEETVRVIVLRDGQTVGKKKYKKHEKITILKRLLDCHPMCFELLIDDNSGKPKAGAPKKDSAQADLLSKADK